MKEEYIEYYKKITQLSQSEAVHLHNQLKEHISLKKSCYCTNSDRINLLEKFKEYIKNINNNND